HHPQQGPSQQPAKIGAAHLRRTHDTITCITEHELVECDLRDHHSEPAASQLAEIGIHPAAWHPGHQGHVLCANDHRAKIASVYQQFQIPHGSSRGEKANANPGSPWDTLVRISLLQYLGHGST